MSQVIVYIEGGVITHITADTHLKVMVIDYLDSKDDENDYDEITEVSQGNGGADLATVSVSNADLDVKHVHDRFQKYIESEGEEA